MGPVRVGRGGVEHFARLLRDLVGTVLPEDDVCIADWHNAPVVRNVILASE